MNSNIKRYLIYLQQESFTSVGYKTGKKIGSSNVKHPFKFLAKKTLSGVGKTASIAAKGGISATKIAGKTAWGVTKGAGKMAKTGTNKVGGVWRGIKYINKAIKTPGKKLFKNN